MILVIPPTFKMKNERESRFKRTWVEGGCDCDFLNEFDWVPYAEIMVSNRNLEMRCLKTLVDLHNSTEDESGTIIFENVLGRPASMENYLTTYKQEHLLATRSIIEGHRVT